MKVVCVGTGMAAAEFAQRLRLEGFGGELAMYSDERFAPYSPCVMPFFLAGEDFESVFWKGSDFFDRYGVTARLGEPVVEVDVERREVRTAAGRVERYDKLFFAAGSRTWAPHPGWLDTRGVFGFKTLTDMLAIDRFIRESGARRCVVFGGGFIGVDAALALRHRGLDVTIVHRNTRLLSQMTDEDGGRFATHCLARHTGMDVRLRATVEEIRAQGGLLTAVRLSPGEWLETPLLIVAVGVTPNSRPLSREDGGVTVDDQVRNHPDVYVAGDVARTRHAVTGATGVYATYPNAMAQARVAARHLVHGDGVYAGSINTNVLRKHIAFPIISAGSFAGDPVTVQEGDVWRRVYLRDGKINGYVIVGTTQTAGYIYQLYVSQQPAERFVRQVWSRPGRDGYYRVALGQQGARGAA